MNFFGDFYICVMTAFQLLSDVYLKFLVNYVFLSLNVFNSSISNIGNGFCSVATWKPGWIHYSVLLCRTEFESHSSHFGKL